MKALIDGDVLVYNIGFSGETSEYFVVDRRDNKDVISFRYKKEVNEWLEENDHEAYVIDKRKTVADLSFVLGRMKTKLNEILAETGADEYRVYLTGSTNFREELVDYYKGNRDPNHKPHWYKEIKAYLIEHWHAIVVEGAEADDAMGVAQKDQSTCICTVDKDLDGVPGWHYWLDKGMYFVTPEEATQFFYFQLLMGDTTDNIRGIPSIGKAKAKDLLLDLDTEEEYFCAALAAYEAHYGTDAGYRMMDENAQLLWMQRTGRIRWTDTLDIEEMVHAYVTS